jgi:molybdate transport system substrate-binding protein
MFYRKAGVFLTLLLIMLCLVSCMSAGTPAESPASVIPVEEELTVAAASDLQFAFTEIAELFEEETGQSVTLVFGSTGNLTQQIENGAPFDLFAAANIDFIERLNTQGLVLEDTIALYARGRVVLAANRQAGVTVATLEDLLDPSIGNVAIANPEHAPYGLAAKQALEQAGLWDALQPKLVLGENVRQTLQYIQTGDAEAGIIALSVADIPEISWVLLDENLHQPLNQALAVITSSSQVAQARAFAAFINGESGRLVMRKYGFILPGEEPIPSTP